MLVLPLKVHQKVVAKFKRSAKEIFPLEAWGYLLGTTQDNCLEITDIWIPEDLKKYAKKDQVDPPAHWPILALEYCEEHELTPLGSIHSHPYMYDELHYNNKRICANPDHATSEADSLSGITTQVHAICRILQSKSGRLTATVKFWGPEIPVKEIYV